MDKSNYIKILAGFMIIFGFHLCYAQSQTAGLSLDIIKHAPNDSVYAALASEEIKKFIKNENYNDGIDFLQRAMLYKSQSLFVQHKLLVLQTNLYYKKKDYLRALSIADSVLKDSASITFDNLVRFYRLKGQCFFHLQDYFKTIEAYEASKFIAMKYGLRDQLDDVLSGLAVAYWEIGNLTVALKYGLDAAKASRETNDMQSLSRILNILGNINSNLKYTEEAKKNYEDCFSVAQKANDREGMILSLSSLSTLERKSKNFTEARKIILRALKFAENDSNQNLISGVLINLSNIDSEEGNVEQAKRDLEKAYFISNQIQNKTNMATAAANLGFIATEEKNYKLSNEYLRKAYDAAKQTNNIALLIEITGGFYDNYKANNQYKEALYYFEQSKAYADSMVNADMAREISQLKTKFAVEQKETELTIRAKADRAIAFSEINRQKLLKNFSIAAAVILLLMVVFVFQRYRERHKTNLILAEKNRIIGKTLQELKATQGELVETEKQREAQSLRVRMARDIHDDIGSGLTKITLLSDVARKKTSQEAIITALSKITFYSKEVSASLNEIVWAVNPINDTSDSLFAFLKNYIHTFLEDTNINYQIYFPDVEKSFRISPEVKRTVFLVLKEALNNIVKYAEAKNIDVNFDIDENNFVFKITDDGNGFEFMNLPSEKREAINGGNGLLNMKNRMLQINGSLSIISAPGMGCVVEAIGKFN